MMMHAKARCLRQVLLHSSDSLSCYWDLLQMSAVSSFMNTQVPKALPGASRKPTYRRSTTTKAPRKRTFVANMQKVSAFQASAPNGVMSFAEVGPASAGFELCGCGNDGNNGQNFGKWEG